MLRLRSAQDAQTAAPAYLVDSVRLLSDVKKAGVGDFYENLQLCFGIYLAALSECHLAILCSSFASEFFFSKLPGNIACKTLMSQQSIFSYEF